MTDGVYVFPQRGASLVLLREIRKIKKEIIFYLLRNVI
jgi:hypothetical protein